MSRASFWSDTGRPLRPEARLQALEEHTGNVGIAGEFSDPLRPREREDATANGFLRPPVQGRMDLFEVGAGSPNSVAIRSAMSRERLS